MVLMVYPFHLYNSGSRRDVIKLMGYLFHLRNSGSSRDVIKHHRSSRTRSSSLHLPSLHELLQRGGVMKPKEGNFVRDALCRLEKESITLEEHPHGHNLVFVTDLLHPVS
jgi:hypothetical protein